MGYHQIKSFLNYWLDATNKYSLHGPFIYDLYTRVIQKNNQEEFQNIENLRKQLLQSERIITVTDFGSGKDKYDQQQRSIADIAKKSLVRPKFGALYNRIIEYYNCKTNIELGTSLGIGTAYMAWGNKSRVITFEGCPETAALAEFHFEFLGLNNIKIVQGNIDATLPKFLSESGKIDFVLIDANHRYEPSLKYFNWLIKKIHDKSILVLDDIHQSKEMEKTWNEICQHEQVYKTIDLFFSGIVFFDPTLSKEHHILEF